MGPAPFFVSILIEIAAKFFGPGSGTSGCPAGAFAGAGPLRAQPGG
jgi:hypothetical protein